MSSEEEIGKKMQELQTLEQNLQGLLYQKQAIQFELNETGNAISEIEKSDGEVYKILGGIMLKSNKESLAKELKEKKKLFDIRVSSIEKQEALIEKKIGVLRDEINSEIGKHRH